MCSEISLTVQKVVKCSPSAFPSGEKMYYLEHPGSTVTELNLCKCLFDFYSVELIELPGLTKQLKRSGEWQLSTISNMFKVEVTLLFMSYLFVVLP